MKKIILLLVAMIFSFGVYAQDRKMPKKDHIMMTDGKMWVMKDGKTTAMDKEITLSNGTVIELSGKVTTTDGTTQILGNGDAIDMDGIVTKYDATRKDKSKME